MRKPATQTITDMFDEIIHAFKRALRYSVRLIRSMSPPALLGAALILAFIISILPMAIVLFAIFMATKLAVGACTGGDRQRRVPREPLP